MRTGTEHSAGCPEWITEVGNRITGKSIHELYEEVEGMVSGQSCRRSAPLAHSVAGSCAGQGNENAPPSEETHPPAMEVQMISTEIFSRRMTVKLESDAA